MRPLIATLAVLAAIAASCGGGDSTGQCPSEPYKQGDRCEDYIRRTCPFVGSKCGKTTCTCENEPGGFRWQCRIAYCSCTCPCGTLVTASCDAIDCTEPQDKCPASAADRCATICADSSLPDLGDDGSDALDGGRLDADGGGAGDGRADARDDAGAGDGSSPDGAGDAGALDAGAGDGAGADAPADASFDAAADATSGG